MTDTPGLPGIDTPDRPLIPRDQWGRPLVVPPDGGKPVGYTRVTTFVDALPDKHSLDKWKQRMVAIGLADRPDLLLSVAAHRSDKDALNTIVEKALEAAKATASATVGTATHALAEQLDRGQRLGVVPAEAQADLDAYRAATAILDMVEIEQFGVCDELKVAGTCDRVVRWYGRYLIADLKTGSLDYAGLAIAQQLALYARCVPYDPARHTRTPRPYPIDQNLALVIHLPAGAGRCHLFSVPIDQGWQAVQCSAQVRRWRSRRTWFTPFDPTPPPDLAAAIAAATSVEQLRALWTDAVNAGTWTDDHLVAALARKSTLEGHAA